MQNILDAKVRDLLSDAEVRAAEAAERNSRRLDRARSILKDFAKLQIEVKPKSFTKRNDMYSPGDEDAPFLSEGFLYPLLGKGDARNVLHYIKQLQAALGVEED